ncbi:hypothetical protein EV421DRAFT_1741780 [Armillaria borealis]|uniref:Uncharacterized protein n=1 Tax=Armillaria borealis TaxID=47425 RepID=A0AA39J0U0_9AGAR|nr:hypothetical protein EV421DRAFT_1741780 [Armillaria borealis]
MIETSASVCRPQIGVQVHECENRPLQAILHQNVYCYRPIGEQEMLLEFWSDERAKGIDFIFTIWGCIYSSSRESPDKFGFRMRGMDTFMGDCRRVLEINWTCRAESLFVTTTWVAQKNTPRNSLGWKQTGKKATAVMLNIKKKYESVAKSLLKKKTCSPYKGKQHAGNSPRHYRGHRETSMGPKPSPPPDPMIAICVCAKRVEVDFQAFIASDLVTYTKGVMRQYFCDHTMQGLIDVFTVPLDRLYEWRDTYDTVLADALQADGCTPRREVIQKVGQPLMGTIRYLEDIWCSAIDGPGALRGAYSKKTLAWQWGLK